MKRYLLFTFNSYYPSGGWNDFVDSYDVIEAAVKAGKAEGHDFIQVVGMETLDIVFFD